MELTEEEKAKLEQEKQEAIAKAVAEREAELAKKHNEEMANLRIRAKNEKDEAVRKAEENAKLTAEEKAKKEIEEQQKREHEELEQLRLENKIRQRTEMLEKAGVPSVFKNDSRLINAADEDVENVIKTIADEWGKVSPKGATTSTNVGGGNPKGANDPFAEFRKEGLTK